jgi:hypothetical protein
MGRRRCLCARQQIRHRLNGFNVKNAGDIGARGHGREAQAKSKRRAPLHVAGRAPRQGKNLSLKVIGLSGVYRNPLVWEGERPNLRCGGRHWKGVRAICVHPRRAVSGSFNGIRLQGERLKSRCQTAISSI